MGLVLLGKVKLKSSYKRIQLVKSIETQEKGSGINFIYFVCF